MEQLQSWLPLNGLSAEQLLLVGAVLALACAAILLLNRFVRWAIWGATRRLRMPYEISITFTRFATGAVWVIALLLVLNLGGVNIAGLWAVLISAAAVIGV